VGEATSAGGEQLAKLDRVVHDFMACMHQDLQGPGAGAGWETVTRFQRILDDASLEHGPVLGAPVLCGVSPCIGIESLLGFLGSLQKTGVLRVRAGDTRYRISVVRGDVVHGVCDPRPEAELLANILMERGVIGRDALDRFFEEWGASESRLVDALNHERLVSTSHLRDALTQQMQQLFDRLLVASPAEWAFHEGEATLCYVNVRLNVNRVLLESARKHDEGNAPALNGAPPEPKPLSLIWPARVNGRWRRRYR
jgi:hypothetical protein